MHSGHSNKEKANRKAAKSESKLAHSLDRAWKHYQKRYLRQCKQRARLEAYWHASG